MKFTSLLQLVNKLQQAGKIDNLQQACGVFGCLHTYTRKNAQVATDLQTSCNKSVHKLLTRCIRTACSKFVRTNLAQAVDKL